MSSPARPRPLVEILKESELVPPTVLARAQRYSETSGRPLWFVLLREGLLTDDKLFRVLESQLKLPVLSDDQLDGVVVAPEIERIGRLEGGDVRSRAEQPAGKIEHFGGGHAVAVQRRHAIGRCLAVAQQVAGGPAQLERAGLDRSGHDWCCNMADAGPHNERRLV